MSDTSARSPPQPATGPESPHGTSRPPTKFRARFALCALVLSGTISGVALGQQIYVDQSLINSATPGLNNGTSWVNAFHSLESALVATNDGATILVAHGMYVPTVERIAGDPRSAAFVLPSGARLVGGYLGGPTGSTNPDVPDGLARLTILSGERGAAVLVDNCYNVLVTSNLLDSIPNVISVPAGRVQRVENLTIQKGCANRTPGAGVLEYMSNGGGIYAGETTYDPPGSVPPLTVFGARLEVEDVLFVDNYALVAGGGLYYVGDNANTTEYFGATSCYVFSNEAGLRGGGFFIDGPLTPSEFSNDDSSWVYNCTFRDNGAGDQASTGNLSSCGGGAVYVAGLDGIKRRITFTNNLVLDNSCSGRGAAYATDAVGGDVDVVNDTFFANTIKSWPTGNGEQPSALYLGDNGLAEVTSCIIWGNRSSTGSPPKIATILPHDPAGGSPPTVQYTDIEGGLSFWTGAGNISADPLFKNPTTLDVRLSTGSPCIDAGNNAAITDDFPDLDDDQIRLGQAVPYDYRRSATFPRVDAPASAVDMGAYEEQ